EGYAKYRTQAFQIPELRNWVVYVSSPELIGEVRRAPDDVLSFQAQVNELLAIPYTMGPSIASDPWHNALAHKVLTSNLGPLVPSLWEETQQAFSDQVGSLARGEWKSLDAQDLLLHVICRITNRMFVGLPLCANEEYTKMSIDYTVTVMIASYIISAFPKFMKPFVSRYVSGAPKATKGFERFLGPVIHSRLLAAQAQGPNWADKPNDFLQWTIDAAPPGQRTVKELTLRMMVMNFAAVHTSSSMFTNVLYNLALHPSYVPALREEAARVQSQHGWTKEGIDRLVRADSFVKETMRAQGIMLATLQRRVLKPMTLSDGSVLRVGADVAANMWGVHQDPSIYEEPHTFRPWRFLPEGEEAGDCPDEGKGPTGPMTRASAEFLTWGHGAHICAGRHFASLEFKLMLAHLVLSYDLKLAPSGLTPSGAGSGGSGERPKETLMGNTVIPGKVEVLFRLREDVSGA
ncbi:cytochrome P450, partial [Calocera cornea HHB12733]